MNTDGDHENMTSASTKWSYSARVILVCLEKPQLPMHISILVRLSAMRNKIRTILILMADYIFAACQFNFTDFNFLN